MNRGNLDSLKVGDPVIISWGSWDENLEKATVEKVHKLHIFAGGHRWKKSNGFEVGESSRWSRHSCIYVYDEKEWNEYVERRNLRIMRSRLRNVEWVGISDDIVKQAYALLPKKAEEAK
jgi:hypothetical protein